MAIDSPTDKPYLIFQIIDILPTIKPEDTTDLDRLPEEDEDLDPNINLYCYRNQRALSYKNSTIIKLFGRTEGNQSILVNVAGFETFFYIGFRQSITTLQAEYVINTLKRKVNKRYINHLTKWELLHRQPYEMFVGDELFPFIKLSFRNNYALKEYERTAMSSTRINLALTGPEVEYYVGESNLDEILKFLHVTNLKPASWAKITKYSTRIRKSGSTNHEIDCHMNDLYPLEKINNSPFKIMIYDLECQSRLGELGEFPVAKKDYQKLARELIDLKLTHRNHPLVTNPLKFPRVLERCLELAFTPNFYPVQIEQIKTIDNLKPTDQLVENVAKFVLNVYSACQCSSCSMGDGTKSGNLNCFECQAAITSYLDSNLPPQIDNNNYFKFSRELLVSLDNLLKSKYATPETCEQLDKYLTIMIRVAFDDYYDRFGITPVFLKGKIFPSREQLITLTPQIDQYLEQSEYDYEKRLRLLTEYLNKSFAPIYPEGDPIIQIGFTFQRLGERECYMKGIYTLDTCQEFNNDDLIYDENATDFTHEELQKLIKSANEKLKEGEMKIQTQKELIDHYVKHQKSTDNARVVIKSFRNEAGLLRAFSELVNMEDPDLVGGYNTFGFDDQYLAARAEELSIRNVVLGNLSRLKNDLSLIMAPAGADKKGEEQKGKRKMETHYLEMKGRVPFDIYRIVPNNYNLPEYKLNYVCKHFLKKVKNDVPPTQIPVLQRGTAKDRAEIARYCVIDCVLCNRLLEKLVIIPNLIAMANVSIVPIRYLLFRGQTVKGYSLVVKKCSTRGKIVRTLRPEERQPNADKYEGAIVLDPMIDIYDQPISVADFNSLYPSSMISENISNDTLVVDPKYDNLPGFHYNTIEYDEFYYVQAQHKKTGALLKSKDKMKHDQLRVCRFVGNKMGILPEIETELIASRKFAKKKMEEAAKTGDTAMEAAWDCQQLAYKVTCNSIYGITGAGVSPIYNKDVAASITATGRKMIIFSKNYVEQNYKNLPITLKRANICGGKTSDIIVRNASCVYGDSVTGETPILVRFGGRQSKYLKISELIPHARLYLKCGDGKEVAPIYRGTDKQGYHIEVWSDRGWSKIRNVIRHKTSKTIYQVRTSNSLVEVTEDHSLLNATAEPLKPTVASGEYLLFSSHPLTSVGLKSISHANLSSMREELQHKSVLITTSQLEATVHWHQLNQVKLNPIINYQDGKYYVLNGNIPTYKHEYHSLCRSVTELGPTTDYVYDLETDSGHFSAGIGEIVVHNTDSIFIKFQMERADTGEPLTGYDAIFASTEICERASLEISLQLKSPQNLEFEKTICPFLLINKKMYKGHYYTKMNNTSFYENTMGFSTKKRDSAPIAKKVVDGLTHLLFNTPKEKVTQAVIRDYLTEWFRGILAGEHPFEDFIRTKSWKGHYAKPDQIAQHVLATRQAIRDPGNQFQVNDRIPFVHIVNPKATLQGDKIETPEYILRHKLKIDYRYYIESLLLNPLKKILSPNRNLGITEKWILNILNNLTQTQQHLSTMDQFFRVITKPSSSKIEIIDNDSESGSESN